MERYEGKHVAPKFKTVEHKSMHVINDDKRYEEHETKSGLKIKNNRQVGNSLTLTGSQIKALIAALIVAAGITTGKKMVDSHNEKIENQITQELSESFRTRNIFNGFELYSGYRLDGEINNTTKMIIANAIIERMGDFNNSSEVVEFLMNLNSNTAYKNILYDKVTQYNNQYETKIANINENLANPVNVQIVTTNPYIMDDSSARLNHIDQKLAIAILSCFVENGDISFSKVFGDWCKEGPTRTYFNYETGKMEKMPKGVSQDIQINVENFYKYLNCCAKSSGTKSERSHAEQLLYTFFEGRLSNHDDLSHDEKKEIIEKQTMEAMQYLFLYTDDQKVYYSFKVPTENAERRRNIEECVITPTFNEYITESINEIIEEFQYQMEQQYPTFLKYHK